MSMSIRSKGVRRLVYVLTNFVPRLERNAVFVLPVGTNLQKPPCRSGLRILPVSRENVQDIQAYRGERTVRVFEAFLDKHDVGVYAYDGDDAVGHAWAALWQGEERLIWGYLPVREGEAAINFCSVKPDCRGQRIYQNMLVELTTQLLQRTDVRSIAISCAMANISSYAAIEKVGFRRIQVLTCLRWAGKIFAYPQVLRYQASKKEIEPHE